MIEGARPARDWTPDEAAIRAQLARILASARFDASERNRRFLRYVVEECLAGRTQQIKAYSIAVSVFNREPSFDPQSDPIVRLEAGRLRRSLEHYYLTAGRNDPIHIVIPKGGYVPHFELTGLTPEEERPAAAIPPAPAALQVAPLARRWPARHPVVVAGIATLTLLGVGGALHGITIPAATESEDSVALATAKRPAGAPHGTGVTIAPFRAIGSPTDSAALAAVLTDEIVRSLSAQTELPVRLEPARADGIAAAPGGQDLRLAGSLQDGDGHTRVIVHLTDEATGDVLWSERFEQPQPHGPVWTGTSALVQALAAGITAPLTDPQGPLVQTVSARLRAKPAEALLPRECAFLAMTERRTRGAEERRTLDACLEKGASVRSLSTNEAARLWSALSYLHADEHRFEAEPGDDGKEGSAGDRALDRALAAAARATELAPNGLRPLTALYTAYCLRRQYDLCFAAGNKALKLAPEDPKVLGDLGLWHVEAGDPLRGMALMGHAMERDPSQAGRLLPAYGVARQRVGGPDGGPDGGDVTSVAPAQVALAVAFVQSGRIDEAREAATKALAADPDVAERSARDQRNRPLPPDLDATIRNSLALLGLAR